MNYPSAGQGVIAGLEDDWVFKHPMWTKPHEDDTPARLHMMIWSSLQPFDGRPNSDWIADYAATCYELAANFDGDTNRLIGDLVVTRFLAIEAAKEQKVNGVQIRAITAMSEKYIAALVKELYL